MFPTNSLVNPLLTDMYQISMSYAYWKAGRHSEIAVFDLFFRKNPFMGEYCIFTGLDEVLKLLSSFRFTESDIVYLKELMPLCDPAFFDYLSQLDCSAMKVYAIQDGSVVFPRIPLLRVEGPLGVAQLLETTLLNLVNYPSLIATNAARMRLAAGKNKRLLEFGLRRAQGPDGAISASKYSYIGGFDGTSNVLAGKLTGISVSGTHAHAFVMSYSGFSELSTTTILSPTGEVVEFVGLVKASRTELGYLDTNEGELAAFTAYAQAWPTNFLCLLDTYDTLRSGVLNYIVVGLVLSRLGYKPKGIRLDSGDLAYLSKECRSIFRAVDKQLNVNIFSAGIIVASNDINEDVLLSLNRESHEIDCFGIGTHLVTCQKQPALGCVYKLVEIQGKPRIKISQEVEKLVIPCRKNVFRLFGKEGIPIVDVMMREGEPVPEVGQRILCRHPFQENLRAFVTPSQIEPLLKLIWDGKIVSGLDSLDAVRARCSSQLGAMRQDHIRSVNPTPYKVSVSASLYDFMHQLWLAEAPVTDLA